MWPGHQLPTWVLKTLKVPSSIVGGVNEVTVPPHVWLCLPEYKYITDVIKSGCAHFPLPGKTSFFLLPEKHTISDRGAELVWAGHRPQITSKLIIIRDLLSGFFIYY